MGPKYTKRAQSLYEWATCKRKNKSINKSRSTKAGHKLSKTFYFAKISFASAELRYESFSNFCDNVSVKKRVISSLKHLWRFYLASKLGTYYWIVYSLATATGTGKLAPHNGPIPATLNKICWNLTKEEKYRKKKL